MKYEWSLIYILIIVNANLSATMFFEAPWGLGLLSVATLFFGAVFTVRDVLHRSGRGWVYGTIAVSALATILVNSATGTPIRIALASVLSLVISEAVDTEIFQSLLSRSWFVRMVSSNIISAPLDTMLFNTLAFGGTGIVALQDLIIGETIWKYGTATVVGIIMIMIPGLLSPRGQVQVR